MVRAISKNKLPDYFDIVHYPEYAGMVRNRIMHFTISQGSYHSFIDNIIALIRQNISAYVCVANVHMFIESYLSPLFAQVVNQAQIVTPDGMPLAWSLSLLYGIKQSRVAGMDLLPDILDRINKENFSIFIYGGTVAMQKEAKAYFAKVYPGLDVKGMHSPPFRAMTAKEDAAAVSMINDSGARMVLVCLGCPKQERWMADMHGKINAVMIGVGGALPVLFGMKKRAPGWMQERGLEWAFRLCQEPRRLFKRYAYTNMLFIFLMMREWARLKLSDKNGRFVAPTS